MSNVSKRVVALAMSGRGPDGNEPQTLTDFKRASKNLQTQQAPIFRKACELAGVEPTRRQASKWNNGYGAAWNHRSEARRLLMEAES